MTASAGAMAPESLTHVLSRIMAEYGEARAEALKGHPLAGFIRKEAAHAVRSALPDPNAYSVEGSPGQGLWARCPWIAVFDPLVTESAMRGFYLVYLFREEMSGVYLSLNQGVTDVREAYKSSAPTALRATAQSYRLQLDKIPGRWNSNPIDLRTAISSSLSSDYEHGNIASVFYERLLPLDESSLVRDLSQGLELYAQLVSSQDLLTKSLPPAEDEDDNPLTEDYGAYRTHTRIERNKKLAEKVKKLQGYSCKACGFIFSEQYPGIEKSQYIEAHHLIPISELKGQKVPRDPAKDFAVLCANCHRMIHRFASPHNVEAFRKTLKD